MKRDAIRRLFEMLAKSQGFYGRLLNAIDNADEMSAQNFWEGLEAQNFQSDLDVILFMEG